MKHAILPETRRIQKNLTAACKAKLEAAWNALVAEFDQREEEARKRKEAEAYEQRIVDAVPTWDTTKKPLGPFEEEVHKRAKKIEKEEETRKQNCSSYRFSQELNAALERGEIPLNSCPNTVAKVIGERVDKMMWEERMGIAKKPSKPVYKTGGFYDRKTTP